MAKKQAEAPKATPAAPVAGEMTADQILCRLFKDRPPGGWSIVPNAPTWTAIPCTLCKGSGLEIRIGFRALCTTCRGHGAVKVNLDALPELQCAVIEKPVLDEPAGPKPDHDKAFRERHAPSATVSPVQT